MNNLQHEYVVQFSGSSKYTPEELERKLVAILGKVGTVHESYSRTPRAYNDTLYSLAISWGYVENYLLQDEKVNEITLSEVMGSSISTAARRLRELEKLGVVYGGPNEYNKHPGPPKTLAEHLTEHPLYLGKWAPKNITFGPDRVPHLNVPYKPVTKGRDVSKEKANKGLRVNLVDGPLYKLLGNGKSMTTSELALALGKTRSTIHRLMYRLVENGLIELTRPEGSASNTWSLSEKAVKLRQKHISGA